MSAEEEKIRKVAYVKPAMVDLGHVTPATGYTCSTGGAPTGKPGCSGGSWYSQCTTGTVGY